MNKVLSNGIKKIFSEFTNMCKPSKIVLKLGLAIFSVLTIAGSALLVYNSLFLDGGIYNDFLAQNLIATGINMLTQFFIASMVFQYFASK